MKMEHINKLEKIQIKKYKLWQVCKFDRRFNGIPKEKQENITNFKHVSAKKLKEYELKESGKVRLLSTGNYVGYTKYDKNDKNINFGEVITIPTGGTANIKYHKGYFIDSGNILISSDLLNLKYLYYFLTNNNDKIQSFYRGAGVQHPSMSDIIEMEIISPPMEVQNEIVEVLDKFSALEAELAAELAARTKQYSYYEEKLLDLPQHEKVILSEYFEYYRGKRLKKSDRIEGMRPLVTAGYQNEGIAEYISNKVEVFDNALTIDMFGNVFWRPYEFSCDDNVIVLKHKDLNEETAYFYLAAIKRTIDDNEFNYNNQYRLKDLYKHEIDLPLKKEKIIYIGQLLSKFSSLVNDIKEGLPAEIELRRKQYEYYRNKLLTFE